MIDDKKIISSGMLATEYLRLKVRTGTVAYLGTQKSAHYLEELGLHTLSIADLDLADTDEVKRLGVFGRRGFRLEPRHQQDCQSAARAEYPLCGGQYR